MTNAIQTIISGRLRNAKTATFKDDSGNAVSYGKIQLETPDMSGEFLTFQNIKVRPENFGALVELQEKHLNKAVRISCSTSTYNNKTSYYFEGLVQ